MSVLLQEAKEIFDSCHINFWLEGSSLRNAVLSQSLDAKKLYLGIKNTQKQLIQRLVDCFNAKGYGIIKYYYQENLFHITMVNRSKGNIYISIFTEVGTDSICPYIIQDKKNSIPTAAKYVIKKSVQGILKRYNSDIELTKFPFSKFFNYGSKVIPATHHNNLEKLDFLDVLVPGNTKEYLANFKCFHTKSKKALEKIVNKDYMSFLEILHRHKIPYCMDSGVLLALKREGKIFNGEKDVDLQMWSGHEEKFINIIPELNALNWKVTIWKYKGVIYQFRIQRPGMIPIHIMIFRKSGDWAWCPASKAIGNPFKAKALKHCYHLFNLIRASVRDKKVETDITSWPWNVRRIVATWWLPAHFFESVEFDTQHQVYVPKEWDKYLEFRYGNWRVPAEGWDFWFHDGAIKHDLPEEMADFTQYPKETFKKDLTQLKVNAPSVLNSSSKSV